jgi:hypothetical protein
VTDEELERIEAAMNREPLGGRADQYHVHGQSIVRWGDVRALIAALRDARGHYAALRETFETALRERDAALRRVAELEQRITEYEGRAHVHAGPEPELTRERMIPWIKWWREATGGTLRDGRDEALRRLGISLAEWEARWRSDDE